MRSERRKQIATLSILLVAVLVISIGFAAFSATLKINSKMTVNPDNTYFKVKFSSNANTLETNAIKASPENKGSDATIDNTSAPTISGISANFIQPGDTATYTFYVRNEGRYEAFLNSITLKDKNCIEAEGTNSELAKHICDSITMSLSVGNITTSETMLDITGESLRPGESKQVTVTISYDENAEISDGPFTVEFGDISMYYATVGGTNEGESGKLIIYRNSTEELSIGDSLKYNRTCAVVPGVANSCVQNDYFNQVFDSKTECEATLQALANSGQLDQTMQYLLNNATCEEETNTIDYETNLSNISAGVYLKHEVVDDIVTSSYACITYTENGTRKDVCLRGGDLYYSSNQATLKSVESYFNTLPYQSINGYCEYGSWSQCSSDSLAMYVDSDGEVSVDDSSSYCSVYSNGNSQCNY